MSLNTRTKHFDKRLHFFLQDIGLLDEVTEDEPEARQVLSRRCCPLHDGADNPRAFLLYKDGFACMTRGCHKDETFGCNLYGLVCHLAYRATDKVMSFREAKRYGERNKDKLRSLIPEGVPYRGRAAAAKSPVTYTTADLAACLRTPDEYFLGRGYRPETLAAFGVGTCVRRLPDGKDLLGWSVVPVTDGQVGGPQHVVGYTARNPRWYKGCSGYKWFHAVERSRYLFNGNTTFLGTEPLFICEGPGDVMRFYEAGYKRAVAVLGSSLAEGQNWQLQGLVSIHRKIYIAADADEAGRKFALQVRESIQHILIDEPKIIHPIGDAKDFGDMSADQIREMTL